MFHSVFDWPSLRGQDIEGRSCSYEARLVEWFEHSIVGLVAPPDSFAGMHHIRYHHAVVSDARLTIRGRQLEPGVNAYHCIGTCFSEHSFAAENWPLHAVFQQCLNCGHILDSFWTFFRIVFRVELRNASASSIESGRLTSQISRAVGGRLASASVGRLAECLALVSTPSAPCEGAAPWRKGCREF